MKILIFGGSFDPPHEGHLRLLKAGIKTLRPDETIILPSYRSPFKKGHEASAKDRLALSRILAREAGTAVRVDEFELKRRRATYTYQAVREFKKRFPKAEFWLLLGSDAAATLKKWKRFDELRQNVGFLVGRRPGVSVEAAGLKKIILPGVFPDLSSTQARAFLIAGAGAKGIPASIFSAVKKRGLYGSAAQKTLRATLKPTRYEHTLSVARLAAELALRHGKDATQAAWAGLLHDAGRRFDPSAMAGYVVKHRVAAPMRQEIIRRNPLLLHAYISGDLAKREFGIKDSAVIEAIRNHTLGKKGMEPLDRLLFVADISSEDRGFPEAQRIRTLAARDIEKAFALAVQVKRTYVLKNGQWHHPAGEALWHWIKERK